MSAVSRIEDAQVSFNAQRDFARHGGAPGAAALVDRAWRVRGFGDFWSHMLVAEGAVDIAVEPLVSPWDMAAVQIIVEAAGGKFTDLTGQRDFEGGSALSTNGIVHDEVLDLFRPA